MTEEKDANIYDSTRLIKSREEIKKMIVYEISTKSYTSPNGPESGTFESLQEKVPYLAELGINCIWLTGHSLADHNHFYNIWTQYACIEPDKIDPTLGDVVSFKSLIDAAHQAGIMVFLDVITHGVMNNSPLISKYPHWFKGGTWGMSDFNWEAKHPDLDEWWVNLWLNYVKEFKIDGFRLDVAHYRPDLWATIRRKAEEMGNPIIIYNEMGPGVTGMSDLLQRGTRLNIQTTEGIIEDHTLFYDVPRFIEESLIQNKNSYHVKVIFHDDTYLEGDTDGNGKLRPIYNGEYEEEVLVGQESYIDSSILLQVDNVDNVKKIKEIIVANPQEDEETIWNYQQHMTDYKLKYKAEGSSLYLKLPKRLPKKQWLSVQLSSHDNGWDGFDGENPYVAQGSRFVFGYSFMLTPQVPLFMAGEEFDADFVPLPKLKPDLFGEKPNSGHWLYGSWIQWDQLTEDKHASMLRDTKKIIKIRHDESDLIYPLQVGDDLKHLTTVKYKSADKLPMPYVYHNGEKLLLVAGNSSTEKDVSLSLEIPFDELGFGNISSFKITNLWDDEIETNITKEQFLKKEWTINKDKMQRGGLLVLKIEPV